MLHQLKNQLNIKQEKNNDTMIFDCHNVPRALDPAVDHAVRAKYRSGYFVEGKLTLKQQAEVKRKEQVQQPIQIQQGKG